MGKAEQINKLTKETLIKPMGDYPLSIESGHGVYFKDSDGNEYLDAVSGEWVVNLGYRHPKIVKAVQEQLKKIDYVTPVFNNEKRAKLAEKLLQLAPKQMTKVLFALSGADAVEGAMHLAMRATGGSEFVCLNYAFHGTTFATLALSYTYPKMYEESKIGLDRYLTRQIRVPNYNCYRCPFNKEYPSCDLACANFIETSIEHAADSKVAGVIVELFQANGGMIPAPEGYIQRLREICNKHGVALIIDEVQTALLRCGNIFASNIFNADPDLIILGKALGGGFPLSAVLAKDNFSKLKGWEAGFTLMSTPVICAASIAMLDVMLEENLEDNVLKMEEYFRENLLEMSKKYNIIGEVRLKGLMIGVELVKDKITKEKASDLAGMFVSHALEKENLLLGKSGPVFGDYGNVIKLKPAVNITKDEASEILKRFENTLSYIQKIKDDSSN
jgi:4-aminobutyrate aminotransferase-like enzyme